MSLVSVATLDGASLYIAATSIFRVRPSLPTAGFRMP